MTETRTQYRVHGLLNQTQNCDRVDAQMHSGFVEVRTRSGKLVFRFDPERMLVEWQDRREIELIDLTPYLR